MKKFLPLVVSVLMFAAIAVSGNSEKEINYKAEFIIDLFNKVEWPAGVDSSKIISIMGDSPIEAKLRELATKKNGIEIKKISITDNLANTKILFVALAELKDLAQVLKKTEQTKVLTISDTKDFARYGIMFNFYREEADSSTGFEFNKMVVKMSGLKVDSDLLKAAKKI